MNEFKNYHPIVNFMYFASVITFSMLIIHPVCRVISFVSGFVFSVMNGGRKTLAFNIKYLLPLILITAVVNPVFSHEGITILCYLPSGNPLTAESVIYGISAAVMLASVVCHFSSFGKIMTSDKLMYLFGKAAPSLSLIFSMTLRFVPRFTEQTKLCAAAQKGIGIDVSQGSIFKRAKNGIKIISVMVTQSLENAVDTADSMRSRGYGLPGRTSFSNFRLDKRDKTAIFVLGGLILCVAFAAAFKGYYFRYFPSVKGVMPNVYSISAFAAYFLLCTAPIIIEIREALRWKKLKSKI